MPITVFATQDGQYGVSGVANNPSVTARLGRRWFPVGAHTIGFDDNFAEPLIVRAYYEHDKDPESRGFDFIGYMQFMRLAFGNVPIPPWVYGGRLADRQPYVFSPDQIFLDFMGPAQAKPDLLNVLYPFYPFNALLLNDKLAMPAGFFPAGLPNGSLYRESTVAAQAAVASIVAEVAPSLLTPADIAERLDDDLNLIALIQPSPSTPPGTEAYRIALDYLQTHPIDGGDTGTDGWLAGLDQSTVAAQLIGNYVLLTLPDDDENLRNTLVIYTRPRTGGGTDVAVHLFDEYDMSGITENAARSLLWRIYLYLKSIDKLPKVGPAPKGRGSRGQFTPPFSVPPNAFIIELKYWTMPVGYREKATRQSPRFQTFDGITWAVMFRYSEDTGQLTPAAIREPTLHDSFSVETPCKAYDTARRSPDAAKMLIDTSNFTKAAMLRENFGGGGKLGFVNEKGIPLT